MIMDIETALKTNIKDKIVLANKIKSASNLSEFPINYLDWESMKNENNLPKLTDQLHDWFLRMVKTAVENKGIGLSANQIGINKNLIVIQTDDKNFKCFVHPTYTIKPESQKGIQDEGCLSVPKYSFPVERETVISASWCEFDESNELIWKNEILTDMSARIWQHETDHLNNTSIVDKTKSLNRTQKRSILSSLK